MLFELLRNIMTGRKTLETSRNAYIFYGDKKKKIIKKVTLRTRQIEVLYTWRLTYSEKHSWVVG